MRAVARWHKETTAAKTERLGNGGDAFVAMSPEPLTVWNGVDGDPSTCGARGVEETRTERGRFRRSVAGDETFEKTRARRVTGTRKERRRFVGLSAIQGMNCPVVLVVEDTESFDARVLDSLW